ncbi:MAG TPA: 50S ribosomal protein L30 [Bacteroidia bacterium]|nr:50S ribosomal protein L30 [Bacteroidia bacterium]
MSKIRITQIRSCIDYPERQKKTLQALGIRKMNVPVEKEVTPQVKGMVERVKHLLKVESI